MKKLWMLLTLLLALCLTACGSMEAPPVDEKTPLSENAAVQPAAPETQGLSGSAAVQMDVPENAPEDVPEDAPDVHTPSEGGNVVAHEEMGYCGNTVTTVTGPDGEPFSFWGNDSVALTDLLLYLDYSEGICRCLPEYTVDTEFGKSYGVNLTESYARYEDSQTALTVEQVGLIREIIERQSEGGTPDSLTR